MSVSQQSCAGGVSRPYNLSDSFQRGPIGPVGPIGHIWTDAILAQAGFDFPNLAIFPPLPKSICVVIHQGGGAHKAHRTHGARAMYIAVELEKIPTGAGLP